MFYWPKQTQPVVGRILGPRPTTMIRRVVSLFPKRRNVVGLHRGHPGRGGASHHEGRPPYAFWVTLTVAVVRAVRFDAHAQMCAASLPNICRLFFNSWAGAELQHIHLIASDQNIPPVWFALVVKGRKKTEQGCGTHERGGTGLSGQKT